MSRAAPSALVACIGVAALGLSAGGSKSAAPSRPPGGRAGHVANCPWIDSHVSIARRVAMIMRKMTPGDEIAVVEGHGTHPYVGDVPQNTALCMPSLGLEDGPNGVGDGMTGVTALPSGAALAATFSRRLAYRYGRVIGAEQAAKGAAVDLGPTVNIDRDPRWGREFESLSEDPYLAAQLVVPEIRGIQSRGTIAQVKHFDAYNQETNRNTPQDDVLVSERALHEIYMPAFRAAVRRAAVGSIMCSYATVNGHYSCQDQYLLTDVLREEWNFNGFVTSDWTGIHDVSAAKAGANIEEPGNRFFGAALRQALRKGVVSAARLNTMVEPILYQMFRFDFFDHPRPATTRALATTAAHRAISTQVAEAGAVLLKNSAHLLPLSTAQRLVLIGPAAAAEPTYAGGGSAHVIPSATVTPLAGIEAIAGKSRIRYAQGLPSNAQLTPIPATDLSAAHAGKNAGAVYAETLTAPQSGTYIIGLTNGCGCYRLASLALDGTTLINNPGTPPVATYSAAAQLTKGRTYALTVSGYAPGDTLTWATPSIVSAAIARAVKAAQSAQIAVVVVADNTESEGADRPDLRLPSAQNALISAVAKANAHTVVVVQAGAPIVMPWLQQVPAVLDTWYPGQTNGTALANLLFGKVDPGGHLPVTFPQRLANVPAASRARFPGVNGKVHYSEGVLVGYRWYEAKHIKPLFPFGFGLSYARFRYSDLRLSRSSVNGVTPVEVSARVINVGRVTGTDVAQLYLGKPTASGEPPRELVGFQRVTLSPGQSKRLRFTITPREEWWWHHKGWTETAGIYRVYVGDSSARADLPLTARYTMKDAVGGRRVTVSAPSAFAPGSGSVVRVSLGAGGSETLHNVTFSLEAPGGWRVAPLDDVHHSVAPDQAATAIFAVTPPSWGVRQYATLYGTAALAHGTCAGVGSRPGAGAHCGVARHGGLTVLLR